MDNLLKITDNFKDMSNFSIDGGLVNIINDATYGNILNINNETKSYVHFKSKESVRLKGGKTYCLSFLGKGAWGDTYVMINNEWKTLHSSWTRCETILKPKQDENFNFDMTLSSQGHIWATQFQIEEGDKFTGFEEGGEIPTPPIPPKPTENNTIELINGGKVLLVKNIKGSKVTIVGDTNIVLEQGKEYKLKYYAKSDNNCYVNINKNQKYISTDGGEDSITIKSNENFQLNITFDKKNNIEFSDFSLEEIQKVKKQYEITIEYVDYDTGKEILSPITIKGQVGRKYSIETKNIDGYKYNYSTDNLVDIYDKDKIIVLYYKKNKVDKKYGKIIVKYVDYDNGIEISDSKILTDLVGNFYNIETKDIDGYKYYSSKGNLNGEFIQGTINITIYYKKKEVIIQYGEIVIKYMDYNGGKPIISETVIKGKVGDKYSINPEDIKGYSYELTYDKLEGIYSSYKKTVTLYYKKVDDKQVSYGEIVVRYVDMDTNREISQSETLRGETGNNYNATQKDITEYIYDYATDGLNGVFSDGKKEITLYYKKQNHDKKYGKITIEYINSKNKNKIYKDDIITGEINSAYNIEVKSISGYKYDCSYDNLKGNFTRDNEVIKLYYNEIKNSKPKPPIPTPDIDPIPDPSPTPVPIMRGAIGSGQFTIIDVNDAQISNTSPNNPEKCALWLDTSVNPPLLKIWNGNSWIVVNDYSDMIHDIQEHINDNHDQIVEQIKIVKETQSKDFSDVQKLKDKITTTITHDDMTKITQTIGSRIDKVDIETNQNKQLIIQTATSTKSELSGINNKVATIMDRQDQDNKKVADEIKDLTTKNVTFEKNLDGMKGQISNVEILTKNGLKNTNSKIADVVATTDNIKGELHNLDKKTIQEINGVRNVVNQNTSGINVLKDKVQSVVESTNTEEIQKMINGKLVNIGQRIDSNSNKIEQTKSAIDAEIVATNNLVSKNNDILNSKVTKINVDLEGIKTSVSHATNIANENSGKAEKIQNEMASMSVDVNGVTSKVKEMTRDVNNVKSDIKDNYTEINQLKDRVTNIIVNNNVEEFTKKINGQMDEVVTLSNKNKQWIETTGDGMTREISGIQTQVAQVKNENGELKGNFQVINNRTLKFQTTLDGFSGEIKSVKDTNKNIMNDVNTKIAKIKATTDEFSSELSNVSNTTNSLGRQVSESGSKIQQLSNQINEKVSEGNLSLEIQKRVNAVQVAFNSINSDIQNDKGILSIKNGKLEVLDKENVNTLFIDDDGLVASNRGYGAYGTSWATKQKSGIHYSCMGIWQCEDDQPIYMHTNKQVILYRKDQNKKADLWAGETAVDSLWSNGNIRGDKISCNELQVIGKKNRIVKTQNFGTRALNAYETADCYFGDIGRNKLSNKQCIIPIDIIFKETVNTNIQYEVFVSPYGNGNVWIETKDMYSDHFIVRGTNDIEFAYEIKVKQRGYENDRLQQINLN